MRILLDEMTVLDFIKFMFSFYYCINAAISELQFLIINSEHDFRLAPFSFNTIFLIGLLSDINSSSYKFSGTLNFYLECKRIN